MVEREVQRIRALLAARQLADASRASDALLARVPENRDVLYLRAVCQRLSGELAAALAALAALERLHPRFGGLYQERGHCHVLLRQAPAAIAAFRRAVSLNPALPASWRMLGRLYRMTGEPEQAAHATAQLASLEELAPAVLTATALFWDGELGRAGQLLHAHLGGHGGDVEAMRLLARVSLAHGHDADAQRLLARALELAPDHLALRFEYAQVLTRRELFPAALTEAERLLAGAPGDRDYLTLHALILVGVGRHAEALERYRELLARAEHPEELHLAIGHSLKTLGRTPQAVDAYRAALDARAGCGEAWWSLANLKIHRFTDEELRRMRAAETSEDISPTDRYHLCFALGKALEDRGEYERSFEYYRHGNAGRRAALEYRPESLEELALRLRGVASAALLARHAGCGAPGADPIFIVGLPRSGSTLIEQILASHPAVEGTQELADLPRMVAELEDAAAGQPGYPEALERLGAADCRRLGERYLEATRGYRTGGRPRFIDKMPNNFLHVGLIHLILPNARIIDVRREPMACGFSNFKQLYARGHDFAYDLTDIARYYRAYLELMRHWDAVLPGRVLRIHYEDVVEDLEGSVRRLLEHCGLEPEPACLAFHETVRSVRTASSEQVRRRIYRNSLGQWRHYERWLGPLRRGLGDALERYRE
jgi:tetratricopeptide (TPR) repeat protein